jgi:hypothetical protein
VYECVVIDTLDPVVRDSVIVVAIVESGNVEAIFSPWLFVAPIIHDQAKKQNTKKSAKTAHFFLQ